MTLNQLDFYFPFFILFYGFLITTLLSLPSILGLAEEHLPAYFYENLLRHRGLALMSLWVGGLWSLQNIMFH